MIPVITGDDMGVQQAAQALLAGRLVAIPTETVYGLAALASDDDAVASLYAAKQRPEFNPLIVHVIGADSARELTDWPEIADALTQAFWPGPLTLVLPKKAGAPVSELATAGLDTVAVRSPAHPVSRAVIALTGPLVAPSANRSGYLSPTTASDVAKNFSDEIALILDHGATRHGVESTVLAITSDEITLLRPGPIALCELEGAIGRAITRRTDMQKPLSPGQTLQHYAPKRAKLRLNADGPKAREAYLGFGPGPWSVLNLSPNQDLTEAAANLFSYLRALDDAGYANIAVAQIPNEGLGEAINDRLRRAAGEHS